MTLAEYAGAEVEKIGHSTGVSAFNRRIIEGRRTARVFFPGPLRVFSQDQLDAQNHVVVCLALPVRAFAMRKKLRF